MSSVEADTRWTLVTAVAPITWGTTYYVTKEFLPADQPIYGAAIRALPAGLLLLAVCRQRPHGSWWWKSLVLGTLNMGAFFTLVYLAAQLLPSSVAATIMATAPVTLMLMAWAMLRDRPGVRPLTGAVLGIAGVAMLVLTGTGPVDPLGVLASIAAMAMSSLGYVLAKRWSNEVDVLASTSWQLIVGGLTLLPVAVLVEGGPPTLDLPAVLAFGYVSVLGTAVAFVAWFSGLRHLPAGTVGLIGLLNPIAGVLLGTVLASEVLTARQLVGLVLVFGGILLGQHRSNARVDRPVRDAGVLLQRPTR
jgi:probable blue pigment (indigoidine) exporter